mgnify:FL=1
MPSGTGGLNLNKIYVIGIGPGNYEQMTMAAVQALEESDTIIGYTVYVDLVKDRFPGKEFLTTPMTKEVDRCVMPLKKRQKEDRIYDLQRRRRRIRHGGTDV